MKRLLLIISIVFIANVSFAQLSVEGTPKTFVHKDLAVLLTTVIDVDQPDLSDVIEQDNNTESMYKTRRFGVILPLGVDFFEKADYAELRCDHCSSITKLKELTRQFKSQGFKVLSNGKDK